MFKLFNKNKSKVIWVDLDGTLSIMKKRSPYQEHLCEQDEVNFPVAETLKLYYKAGYRIIICSGRDSGRGMEATLRWLKKNKIKFHDIYMRKSKDMRKDSIVKKEFLDIIREKYEVFLALDDRNQVIDFLRGEEINTFQVNYGNF